MQYALLLMLKCEINYLKLKQLHLPQKVPDIINPLKTIYKVSMTPRQMEFKTTTIHVKCNYLIKLENYKRMARNKSKAWQAIVPKSISKFQHLDGL